jgi:hypothetical protein
MSHAEVVGVDDQELLVSRITKSLSQGFRVCLSRQRRVVRLREGGRKGHQNGDCQEFSIHC